MSEPLKWTQEMEAECLANIEQISDASIIAFNPALHHEEHQCRVAYLAARQRGADRIAELEVRIIDLEDRLYHAAHDALELEAEVKSLQEAGKVSEYVSDPPTAPTEGA